ncbi:transcriptional regulator, DeoR family [Lacrimispora sphenoides]|jgi:DeoR/GlpR family transcriptional regulator of sugar metabolism|uniref:DNA-binding transcriptional regulator of sugar metabolism, DeoR/GlpR family n=1 Tax=Lacrimispora sphenoides JCM 1415 TaxID=1297793 RepID=A0ABY1C8E9_9FIRM|nr:DeoR/GlpR family DNA-binding transcription regulator [Lacrimispora sphenoides]SET79313.1 DNA-binding transcriptional regulator of sugar metabolism, DeoR/GlpR family [[Clostridium] sphenoides JCM 1415]SEU32582.1 transcriptional regulator, DeoR family [Lacrimispora sphenoides]SUY51299.1 transcriptional regulator, DeoR family [Lacrimispora sphenoides]
MKREYALVEERREHILDIVRNSPKVSVNSLAEQCGISVITVRRDLQYLEDRKLLKRCHGGAIPIEKGPAQANEILLYRRLIASYAATLVDDNDTLFINTSSTALQILEYIKSRNVTVITNNGKAINSEHGAGVNIILTGGELRYPKEAMVGDLAVRNLQNIYAKKAFMGCSGISVMSGMTTEIMNEVCLNELMIEHTRSELYILADHTKIGKNSSFSSCSIGKVQHLITDEKAPEEILKEFKEAGVQIHQVKKGGF